MICYWTDARQHGIYLFYIITKQITTRKDFKILQHNAKAGLCSRWRRRKKPFDVIYDLCKMKQFHWLLCVAKNCDWSRKITPLSNVFERRFSWNENLQRKQNWTAKSTNLEGKVGKNQVGFCHQSSPLSRKALTLPWKLQELKKYSRKTCGCRQPRGHLIRVWVNWS